MKREESKLKETARPLRYHLRYQLVPGRRLEADAADLVTFCQRHGVEEVVLFIAAEEWNMGILSVADERCWIGAVTKAAGLLRQAGIATSLNPWVTSLHTARGRGFPPERTFKPMVSPSGQVSAASASFADPDFQEHLVKLYGRFASHGFRVLWIEDDFRYHNHGPLDWGGGFEQPMLDLFAAQTGRKVTREEVVAALLKAGKPHPWRLKWQALWGGIHLDLARRIAEEVARCSGGTATLGLMTSSLPSHSVEGRKWHEMFEALAINGRVVHRPHFAIYREAPGRDKVLNSQMLDLQKGLRIEGCEVAPEIENSTFTRWHKSDTQTWSEMALCQIHGADSLLLDLFPFSGNPPSAEPEIGELLDNARPALEWLAANFPAGLKSRGVGVPYKTDAAAKVRLAKSATDLAALQEPSPYAAGRYCLQYGIPVSAELQEVNALFGSLAWAFDDAELESLLAGGLLLDGGAAEILLQRGFGPLIGLKELKWVDREEDFYSLEKVVEAATGVEPGTCLNVNLVPRMAQLTPRSGASAWTRILRANNKSFGPGWLLFKNHLGGRVALCSMDDPASVAPNYKRRAMAQSLITFLGAGAFSSPMAVGGPHQLVIHLGTGREERVVLLNGGTDPAEPRLVWPRRKPSLQWQLLRPLEAPEPLPRNCRLPYLGIMTGVPR